LPSLLSLNSSKFFYDVYKGVEEKGEMPEHPKTEAFLAAFPQVENLAYHVHAQVRSCTG